MIEIIENKIYLKTKSISTELSMQVKKVKVYSKLVTVRYIATPLFTVQVLISISFFFIYSS